MIPSSSRDQLAPGTVFGRYIVLEVVGEGGMGVVYAAYDNALARRIALKLVRSGAGPRANERLIREARAMARVSHPNVVPVYDVGTEGDQVFIAMELIQGQNLREWLQEQERSWREIVDVFVQAGHGLAAAHQAGLVHRDFKPGNALVNAEGKVCVVDFGIAAGAGGQFPSGSSGDRGASPGSPRLTDTGAVVGTPAYMPPEQYRGGSPDARSDQFSFCSALYFCLYDELPYGNNLARAYLEEHTKIAPAAAPTDTRVPLWLRKLVLRGLEPDPSDRWPSMAALLGELERRLRPPRWYLLGIGLAVGAAFFGITSLRSGAELCGGTDERIDAVWHPERETALELAFEQTEISYAEDTWSRVAQGLDDYAAEWSDVYAEACEQAQTAQSTELDHQMACLDRRLRQLDALLAVFATPDAGLMREAVHAVNALSRPAQCTDAAGERRVPPPDDPRLAREVEALRASHEQADALFAVGRFAEGTAVAEPIAARAKQLGYGPFEAEIEFSLGLLLSKAGRVEEGEQHLFAAFFLANEHGDDALAAEVSSLLVFTLGYGESRIDEGLKWARHAEAALARCGACDQARATLLNAVGLLLGQQGRADQAIAYLVASLELREQMGGRHSAGVAMALNNIGVALNRRRRYDEALSYYHRALATWQRALGPQHPDVANGFNNLGTTLLGLKRQDDALAYFHEARELRERTLGPDHPDTADCYDNIGVALAHLGRREEGRRYHERAFEVRQAALPPFHEDMAASHANLAAVYHALGQLELAVPHHEQRIREAEASGNPGSLANNLRELGWTFCKLGRMDEARATFRRELEALGPSPKVRDLVYPLAGLGRTLLDTRPAEARAHIDRALAACGDCGPNSPALARARFAEALLLDRSRRKRARAPELAAQALEAFRSNGTAYLSDADEVEAWLSGRRAR